MNFGYQLSICLSEDDVSNLVRTAQRTQTIYRWCVVKLWVLLKDPEKFWVLRDPEKFWVLLEDPEKFRVLLKDSEKLWVLLEDPEKLWLVLEDPENL